MKLGTLAVHTCALLLTLASVSALADTPARPYKYGSVWVVASIRMKPGMEVAYKNHIATEWKAAQEEQKKAGIILSYRAFVSDETYSASSWNILLMKEYKDLATLEATRSKLDELDVKLAGGQQEFEKGYRDREAIREILDQKITQEVIFQPSN